MKKSKEILKEYFETGDKPTQQQYADLIDSFIDAKQAAGESDRRFVIDENGEVNVAVKETIPEYSLSEVVNNKMSLLKDDVPVKEIDLTQFSGDNIVGKRGYHSSYRPSFHDVVINKTTNEVFEDMYTEWQDVPLNDGYSASFLRVKIEGKFLIIQGSNVSGSSSDNVITSNLPFKIQSTQFFRGGGTAGMQDYFVPANSSVLRSALPLQGFNEFFAVLLIQIN
ncbi:hypothetical protein [Tenacibaculum agarivorans]|uniref:hypothetical protein n=1 Tax=Tenacibaculum agarivorans TaxID=1908389 RepID=UPI00094BC5CC|nr:hypothetical protein [Tenacibaculum agarivorans]